MAHGPLYESARYWGKVTHQRLGETKGGTPQLILSFLVLGRVNLADPEGDLLPCPQQERTMYRPVTDKTMDYVRQDLDALEWFGARISQFDEEASDCADIRGKELAFFCKHKPKQIKDETTGEWVATSELREEWSIAQAGPVVKPLDQQKTRALDSMFGRALKDRKKPTGNGTQPATRKTAEPKNAAPSLEEANAELANTDDIPF